MGRKSVDAKVAEIRAQANAARRAAETAEDGRTRNLVSAGADTLDGIARSQQRRAKAAEAVLVLAPNVSDVELRQARLRRAVRRGCDVYLPSWREATVAMPNVLLRSALFAARTPTGEALMEEPIASQGDTVVTLTGHPLCDYDRRVFAACLNYYRDERPLSDSEEAEWVRVSYWQLAQDLKVAYGANVHRAIRESLIRLNAAHLRIRVRRQDIPMPHLIEVAFDDGYAGKDASTEHLRGSDLVAFRVLESMARLFGPDDWSAVSELALHGYSGLTSWLTGFYSTHAGPYAVAIADLYRFSGAVCEMREFRRRLKVALERLTGDDVPESHRVAAFALDKTNVTVKLARWSEKDVSPRAPRASRAVP